MTIPAQFLDEVAGRVKISYAVPLEHFQGLPTRDGALIVRGSGTDIPEGYAQGLPLFIGKVLISTGTLPIVYYWQGLAFIANGAIAANSGLPIDNWHDGLPFTADGRLCVGVPADEAPPE